MRKSLLTLAATAVAGFRTATDAAGITRIVETIDGDPTARRTGHTPKVRPAGEAQREAHYHNAALKPRRTVSEAMTRFEAESKAKVSRFSRQNNSAARPGYTYRPFRRDLAKTVR